MKGEPTIAVVNSSEDTVEMLRACLQEHGFSSVVTAHVFDIKNAETDFLKFLDEHDPAVFLWDVSIPYEENWRFLQLLMTSDRVKGRRFVLTTTNKKVLESMVGPTDAYEIVGKPYDLDSIVNAVKKAAGQGGPPKADGSREQVGASKSTKASKR